jgi:NACHT domain
MLRQWLSAPDPFLKHQQVLKDHLAGTGLWFLEGEQYANWKTDDRSFLWLYGIPGSGKSVLCSAIVEDLLDDCQNDPGKAVAYYYFSFSSSQDQSLEPMLRSLIMQLSEKCLKAPKGLESLLPSEIGRRQPSHNTLLAMLRTVIQALPYSYIVLDALDECKDDEELLKVIETVAAWEINSLHMIVLSRDQQDIRSCLEDFAGRNDMISLQSSFVNEDIALYIRYRLLDDKKFRRWRNDNGILHEIETELMSKANGM